MQPNKLTVHVSRETPEGTTTSDNILTDVILKGILPDLNFQGDHKIQYTVQNRAKKKGICKEDTLAETQLSREWLHKVPQQQP